MKLKSHIHQTAAALCVLALSPTLMFAAGTTHPSKERGIIKSVNMEAQTLVVTDRKNNSEHTFQWNDQTIQYETFTHPDTRSEPRPVTCADGRGLFA